MTLGDPQSYFSSKPEAYKKIRPPYPREAIDWALGQANLPPGAVIADMGGGNGLLGLEFARRGYHVIIVDPDQDEKKLAPVRETIEREKLQDKVTFQKALAHNTGLQPHSVDLIIAGNASHWFLITPEASMIPAHWQNILKPGGKAAFFCMAPSLTDPMTKAVHDEMGKRITSYRDRPTHVLCEPDRTDADADQLLNEVQRYHQTVPVTIEGLRPADMLLGYLDTTRTAGPSLRADEKLKNDLLDLAVRTTTSGDNGPLLWDCDVYMGTPRERLKARGTGSAMGGPGA